MKSIASICLLLSLFTSPCKEEDPEPTKVGFLREVLQPVGIPLVTCFHYIRENPFLNTRVENSNFVESVGDLFLIPSQYLFCGQTVALKSQTIALRRSFDYEHLYWLKTAMALALFPIAEPIGLAIKTLSLLSKDVRSRHAYIQNALSAQNIHSQLPSYKEQGITQLHSEEFIPCQKLERPSRLTRKQKIEIEALAEIIKLLDEHQIIYWIDWGTCLGAYRYGGIIPWDWDIDMGILQDDHDNVKQLLSTLPHEKYMIQDWSSYSNPKTMLKLYVKETKNFIDIYHYRMDAQARSISYISTFQNSPFPKSWNSRDALAIASPLTYSQIFPLKKAHFDTLIVWAPHEVVDFLHTKYGSNLEPSMLWDASSQTYLQVEDHPFWKE